MNARAMEAPDRLYGPPAWEPVPNVKQVQLLRLVALLKPSSPEKRLAVACWKEGDMLEVQAVHKRSIGEMRLVAVRLPNGTEHVWPADVVTLLP